MKEILLTQGMVALVDDEDFEMLNQYKWTASRNHAKSREHALFYASRSECKDGKKRTVYMHREILQPKTGELCDHIDGNTLNNTRANLRAVTRSQNATNRGGWGTSKFLGVNWHAKGSSWCAQIQVKGKKNSLGLFKTEREAALCYNEAAKKAHGEYARLNVV